MSDLNRDDFLTSEQGHELLVRLSATLDAPFATHTPQSHSWSNAPEQLFLCIGSVNFDEGPARDIKDFVCWVSSPIKLTEDRAIRSFRDTGLTGYVVSPWLLNRKAMEIWEEDLPERANWCVSEPNNLEIREALAVMLGIAVDPFTLLRQGGLLPSLRTRPDSSEPMPEEDAPPRP